MMENTNTNTVNPMQHAIRMGVIYGLFFVVLTVVVYIVDYSFLASWKFGALALVLALAYVIYAGINCRNQLGGYMPYKQAFVHGWLVLAIMGLIYSLFNILLYTVIDPELPAKLIDASIDQTRSMMESFGASEDVIDEAMDKTRTDIEDRFSISGVLSGFGISLIIYLVIAAITAIFVKKNKPEETF